MFECLQKYFTMIFERADFAPKTGIEFPPKPPASLNLTDKLKHKTMAQPNRKRGMNFVRAGGGGAYNAASKPISSTSYTSFQLPQASAPPSRPKPTKADWFDDDDEDPPTKTGSSLNKEKEQEEEEDPLEAFMAQNAKVVEKQNKTIGEVKDKGEFLDETEPDVVDAYLAKKEVDGHAFDDDGLLKDEGKIYPGQHYTFAHVYFFL
jgi:hypothetical protein